MELLHLSNAERAIFRREVCQPNEQLENVIRYASTAEAGLNAKMAERERILQQLDEAES